LFCIGDGRALDDPDRPTLIEGNYSLRPADEMEELFAYAPGAVASTLEINNKIHIEFQVGVTLLPKYTLPEEEGHIWEEFKKTHAEQEGIKTLNDNEWYLRYLCYLGLKTKYEFEFDDSLLFDLIQKRAIHYPDTPVTKISPAELVGLSRESFTSEKEVFYEKLSPQQKIIIERLEYELTVIDLMGFNSYFIIVADFVGWAKKNGIPV